MPVRSRRPLVRSVATRRGDIVLSSPDISDFSVASDARISAQKAQINGLATLDGTGFVPSNQLPSYVDDVIEAANFAGLPGVGVAGKIYVTLDTGRTYRWSGSAYVEISSSAVLSVNGLAGTVVLTTANLDEVTNLYWTNARFDARVATATLPAGNLTGDVPPMVRYTVVGGDTDLDVAADGGILRLSSAEGIEFFGNILGGFTSLWTGTFHRYSIGITSSDGVVLSNLTPATAVLNQYSPRLHFTGNGWKTNAVAASQTVDFVAELATTTGAAAPSGTLNFNSAINGGAYTTQMSLSSSGVMTVGGTTVSLAGHTHVAANVTDFSTAADARIAIAALPAANLTGSIADARIAITALPAANLTGAIADARIATTLLPSANLTGTIANVQTTATSANTASAIVTRDGSGNFTAGTITATLFSGSGASLTSIPAANLTGAGTLADARLTSNVPLKNAGNTFSTAQTFGGTITVTTGGASFTGTVAADGLITAVTLRVSDGGYQFFDANWKWFRDDANVTGDVYSLVTQGSGSSTRQFLWCNSNLDRKFGCYIGYIFGSAGVVNNFFITPIISQSGTAGYNALFINVNEASFGVGSGPKNLIVCQIGGVDKFRVTNGGAVVAGVKALTDGANIATDATLGNLFTVTLAGNRTMDAPASPASGQQIAYRLKQDATGIRTITWNAAFRFTAATPPVLTVTAAKTDYIVFVYNAADTKWDCIYTALNL